MPITFQKPKLWHTNEEIIGQKWQNHIYQNERKILTSYHDARKKGKPAPSSYETKLQTKDGDSENV